MLLSHNVYFTLKDNSPAKADELVAACRKYLTVQPGIAYFCCGKLIADLKRDVNDTAWEVALNIVFENREFHDSYQDDPTHNKFIDECKYNWSNVRVFDSYVEKA